jgi:hypothetical protein
MANLIAAIDIVMYLWHARKLNNRQAYEQISELILQYQKDTWNENH